MSKYCFEIPVNDNDDNFEFSYDKIVTNGDSLQELLDSAVVTVVNKYGRLVYIQPVDAEWMLELVQQEYIRKKLGAKSFDFRVFN